MDLHSSSVFELARAIREKKVTATAVVSAHIERATQANSSLNAIVHPLFELARERAIEADLRIQRDSPETLPPLLGVPFTLKDAFAYQGAPWCVGSDARRGIIADRTASVILRLVEAGAVPLAITNVPEALTWLETDNRVYGRTNNPYDLARTPGGSSGGEAALIASGASPFGVGTDFAGSIRVPASFCGVAGLKPTPGIVSQEGVWPDLHGQIERISCTGPLARQAKDLYPLLRIMAQDPKRLPDQAQIEESKMRIFYFEGGPFVSLEIRRAVKFAAELLRQQGFRVERWNPPHLRKWALLWFAEVSRANRDGIPFSRILGNGEEIPLARELFALGLRRSSHMLPALGLAGLEQAIHWIPGMMKRWSALAHELREVFEEKLGPNGALVLPTFPTPALRHGEMLLRSVGWGYSGIFNALHMPAATVPVGRSRTGLPLGLQVAATAGNDALCCALAERIEAPCTPLLPLPT